jgi:hypothetical protein
MLKIVKSLVVAGALFGAGLSGIAPASAMPIAPAAAPAAAAPVQTIGWRCGVGWHINPWGRCVPNRVYRPYYRPYYHPYYRPYYHRRYYHPYYHRHYYHRRYW